MDVISTGEVVPDELLNSLFDAYTPVSLRVVREHGSSLCLAIVKRLVTLLHGAVTASRTGLPAVREPETVFSVALPVRAAPGARASRMVFNCNSMRILIGLQPGLRRAVSEGALQSPEPFAPFKRTRK